MPTQVISMGTQAVANNVAVDNASTVQGTDVRGRVYGYVKSGASAAKTGAVALKDGFIQGIDASNRICGSAESLQKAVQLTTYTLMASQLIVGSSSEVCGNVVHAIGHADELVDATGIVRDLPYVLNGDAGKDWSGGRKCTVIGRMALIIGDIGAAAVWLGSVGIDAGMNCLSALSGMIGRCGLFKCAQVSVVNFMRGAFSLGFIFMSVDVIRNLIAGGSAEDYTRNTMTLAYYVAECAKQLFLLAGFTNPVVVVGLGLLAAGTGLTSFLYTQYHPEQEVIVVKAPALILTQNVQTMAA